LNFYNSVFVSALVGWGVAQILKTILFLIFTRNFRFERLFGAGGMPSSHSAMVCAAVAAMAKLVPISSPEFAVMSVLALIVMYDAMSVRRASGLHAREINKLNNLFGIKAEKYDNRKDKKLKEFLGHTPLEVFCGAVLGVAIGLAIPVAVLS
jgi:acid phosphatase family membrane protein YuiD